MTDSEVSEFTFPSAIRGFHVYRRLWRPHTGERLQTKKDDGNREDRFAVAVVKSNSDDTITTVGHLHRELSHLLWHFLTHGGEIECEVTGRRRRSPLVQGGLEIPCSVTLRRKKKLVARAGDIIAEITLAS